MESVKSTTDTGPIALVAKEEVLEVKKSKEKVVVVYSAFDATSDEFTSEEKELIVRNPKKLFKKISQSSKAVETLDSMVEGQVIEVEIPLMKRTKAKVQSNINKNIKRTMRRKSLATLVMIATTTIERTISQRNVCCKRRRRKRRMNPTMFKRSRILKRGKFMERH